MQGDGNANTIGGGSNVNFIVGCSRVLMASRMICHGAASRCMTSESANGTYGAVFAAKGR